MAASFLSCRACLTSTLRTAAYRSSSSTTTTTTIETASRLATPSAHLARRRRYTTAVLATEKSVDAPQSLQVPEQDAAVAQQRQREKLQRAVKKHLAHMDDPWKIAQHVEQTLLKNRFDEALLLTQQSSKDGQVVVAWNHLIGYLLEKQQLKQAIKLFNEASCAKSQHPKAAVAEAVKHYNLLMADKRIQPNSIHLNAVLNVCARAGDLDSMFLIADTANDSTRAPTAYTYTTILNALRHDAVKDILRLPSQQQAVNIQRAIDRSKGLWVEVMEKWKQGRVVIDEELVCAMGRVLLLAPKREDKRDVLDLLHQTMNIPNLNKENLETAHPSQDAAVPDNNSSSSSSDNDTENNNKNSNKTLQSKAAATAPIPTRHNKALYAIPGRNTLALLLTTLASSKLTTSGIKYWNLMVRQYGIVPDMDNWLRLFGLLKVAKASAHAASTLDMIPDEFVNPKPYQIAMQTCVRDNINPNVIHNANTVLNSMLTRLPVPDIHTLRLYLRVALVSHFHLRTRAQKGDQQGAKRDYGVQLTTALARLWDPYKKLHYHYFKAQPATLSALDSKAHGILYNNKREVVALARLMFSSFNKVVNEKMLPEKDLRELRPVGAKINREIQAFYSNREQLEPKLRRSSTATTTAATADAAETSQGDDLLTATEHVVERHGGDFVWDTTKSGEPVSLRSSRR
ncbi:hypothetical protein E4U43_006983 [Claviceps pusilla]|uniref:Pentatricopeptide repeat protein n=1 Tax=Claviceps pusilla TaxID=123648 RepID=A0A9P7SYF3_9HYPO|nr:hypothetical protein E4U43_006983 [Claviceps pusilla]